MRALALIRCCASKLMAMHLVLILTLKHGSLIDLAPWQERWRVVCVNRDSDLMCVSSEKL